MTRLFGRLGFIHRRLWQQDAFYRTALLFGPAPLLGCLLAGAVWGSVEALGSTRHQVPQWAVPQGPKMWSTANDQPNTMAPTRPLPPTGADGALAGYVAGWQVATAPIQVSPTLDVDVKRDRLTHFVLDQPIVDMSQIIAGGPKDALYVGVGLGFLVVRAGGIYALSLRLERPAARTANCLTRLGLGPHRIISSLGVAISDDVSKTFDAARFDLQPGLYSIGWAFGCWHDQQMTGPGRLVLLIGHPGEPTLQPVRPSDIVRTDGPER
jgi:hypothetical protein